MKTKIILFFSILLGITIQLWSQDTAFNRYYLSSHIFQNTTIGRGKEHVYIISNIKDSHLRSPQGIIIQFDLSGNMQWKWHSRNASIHTFSALIERANGNILAGGSGKIDKDTYAWLVELTPQGEVIQEKYFDLEREKKYNESFDSRIFDIYEDPNGDIYICGESSLSSETSQKVPFVKFLDPRLKEKTTDRFISNQPGTFKRFLYGEKGKVLVLGDSYINNHGYDLFLYTLDESQASTIKEEQFTFEKYYQIISIEPAAQGYRIIFLSDYVFYSLTCDKDGKILKILEKFETNIDKNTLYKRSGAFHFDSKGTWFSSAGMKNIELSFVPSSFDDPLPASSYREKLGKRTANTSINTGFLQLTTPGYTISGTLSGDGRIFTAVKSDNTIQLIDMENKKLIRRLIWPAKLEKPNDALLFAGLVTEKYCVAVNRRGQTALFEISTGEIVVERELDIVPIEAEIINESLFLFDRYGAYHVVTISFEFPSKPKLHIKSFDFGVERIYVKDIAFSENRVYSAAILSPATYYDYEKNQYKIDDLLHIVVIDNRKHIISFHLQLDAAVNEAISLGFDSQNRIYYTLKTGEVVQLDVEGDMIDPFYEIPDMDSVESVTITGDILFVQRDKFTLTGTSLQTRENLGTIRTEHGILDIDILPGKGGTLFLTLEDRQFQWYSSQDFKKLDELRFSLPADLELQNVYFQKTSPQVLLLYKISDTECRFFFADLKNATIRAVGPVLPFHRNYIFYPETMEFQIPGDNNSYMFYDSISGEKVYTFDSSVFKPNSRSKLSFLLKDTEHDYFYAAWSYTREIDRYLFNREKKVFEKYDSSNLGSFWNNTREPGSAGFVKDNDYLYINFRDSKRCFLIKTNPSPFIVWTIPFNGKMSTSPKGDFLEFNGDRSSFMSFYQFSTRTPILLIPQEFGHRNFLFLPDDTFGYEVNEDSLFKVDIKGMYKNRFILSEKEDYLYEMYPSIHAFTAVFPHPDEAYDLVYGYNQMGQKGLFIFNRHTEEFHGSILVTGKSVEFSKTE